MKAKTMYKSAYLIRDRLNKKDLSGAYNMLEEPSLDVGSRYKKFRVYPIKYFQELVDEVKNNPYTSYVTYLNDLILSGYSPQYVYGLEKFSYEEQSNISETVSSRIMNYMQSPVTYQMYGKRYFKGSEKTQEFPDETFSVSVNFSQDGEIFIELSDIIEPCKYDKFYIIKIVEAIKEELYKWYESKDGFEGTKLDNPEYKTIINKYVEDFLYAYLIRRFLLNDSDFSIYNSGIIVNPEKGELRMAPNFDMENSFKTSNNLIDEADQELMSYVYKRYPHIIQKFENMLRGLSIPDESGNPKYQSIVNNALRENEDVTKEYCNMLEFQIETALGFVEFAKIKDHDF